MPYTVTGCVELSHPGARTIASWRWSSVAKVMLAMLPFSNVIVAPLECRPLQLVAGVRVVHEPGGKNPPVSGLRFMVPTCSPIVMPAILSLDTFRTLAVDCERAGIGALAGVGFTWTMFSSRARKDGLRSPKVHRSPLRGDIRF